MQSMKKRIGVFLLLAVIAFCSQAGAELSTNLQIRKEFNRANKKVASETYVDQEGNPVIAADKGYATIRYTYGQNNLVTRTELLDAEGNPINGKDGYARIERKYREKKIIEQKYIDASGNLVTGPEGYARLEATEVYGKFREVWEYDPEGNPVNTHQITLYYDKKKIKSDSWYDVNDNLTVGPNGYARMEAEYVSRTQSKVAYYDAEGNPFFYAKAGYARMEREFDRNQETAIRYYGVNGELIPGPNGYAYALYSYHPNSHKRAMYYNADGTLYYTKKGVCGVEQVKSVALNKITEEYYFIGENQRGKSVDGYSGVIRKYSQYKILASEQYLDENDKPMIVEGLGYSRVKNTIYNKRLIVLSEYLDENGKPVLNVDGYASQENKYVGNMLVSTTYYGTDNKTPVNIRAGYAKVTYERDAAGNPVRTNWYDADGNSCRGEAGTEEVRNEWVGGNKIAESYWTANGIPAKCADGYHEVRSEYNGMGKVTRQEYYNAAGRLTACVDGWATVETEYNSKGSVMCRRYYNTEGTLMLTPGKEYAYARTILLQDLSVLEEADEEDPESEEDGLEVAEKAEEEEETQGTRIEYYGIDKKLIMLKAGYACVEKQTNEAGKVIRESYYDTEGQLVNLNAGYAVIVRDYDQWSAMCREAYYGADGGKVTLAEGYHYLTRKNDLRGLALSTAYYDADGKPVINSKTKYHRVDKTYLDDKHVLSEAWFGTDGRYMTINDTYAIVERSFDSRGRVTDQKTFDTKENPVECAEGYDEVRTMYNDQGQAVQTEYLSGGKLKDNIYGVAVVQREYDTAGYVAAEWYLSQNGITVIHQKNNYHRVEKTYLDEKHVTSEAWFDPWGKPMTHGDAYVKIKKKFDEKGNTIDEITYDRYGNRTSRKDGYDEVRRIFDENGRAVKTTYLINGQPAMDVNGVAVLERAYDEAGNITAEAYFGTNGEPVIHEKNKYHRIEKTYLDAKHVLSEAWFDTDGKPMTKGDAYVKIAREFDEKGNTVREVTLNASGQPTARVAGYDEIRRTFNENNQAIRTEYLLNGKLVLTANEYAVIERIYDENGRIATEVYFGIEGEPVTHKKNKYHRIDRTWLDDEHATSEAWFDKDEKPMTLGNTYVRVEREFDERGNTIEERYFGPDGTRIACKAGYDAVKRVYNERNKASWTAWFLHNEPFVRKEGYAAKESEYDEAGNVNAEWYFDTEGAPVNCKKGYAGIRRIYNEKKQVIREAWFNTKKEPTSLKDTYCAVSREYDEAGNIIVEKYLDGEGNATCCAKGYEMVWKRYNDQKQVIYESYMDHDGNPMSNKSGVFQTTYDYNAAGKVIQEQYFDSDGNPMNCMDGYFRIVRTYDKKGKIESEKRVTTNGEEK